MIALDLSRLLSRAGFATPTGIDRVELAYARHFLANGGEHCFAAINAVGGIGALPRDNAARFVERLEGTWRGGAAAEAAHEVRDRSRLGAALFRGVGALQSRLREIKIPPICWYRTVISTAHAASRSSQGFRAPASSA